MIANKNLPLDNDIDIIYMQRALKLAKKGRYTTSPNPCVGCVIVKDNVIIGEGYHKKAGLGHAEVNALLDCKKRGNADKIEGSCVYVTLEPCSHYGRTPPCAKALCEHKVSRVVIASRDSNPKVSGGGIKILQDANIEVKVGVLESEAMELNRWFFKSIESKRPYIIAKSAMSLDSKVANYENMSQWITNEKARNYGQKIRAYVDCILTSSKTVLDDDPKLNVRAQTLSPKLQKIVRSKYYTQAIKVILDTEHKVDLSSRQIIQDGICYRIASQNSTYFKEKVADKAFKEKLENILIEDKLYCVDNISATIKDVFIPHDTEHTSNYLNLDYVLAYLDSIGVRRVLLECGSTLLSSFINDDLVDEHLVFIAPKYLGKDGLDAFFINNVKDVNKCKEYSIKSLEVFDNNILIDYMR